MDEHQGEVLLDEDADALRDVLVHEVIVVRLLLFYVELLLQLLL